MIPNTTTPKTCARRTATVATCTRPARPRLIHSRTGERTKTKPPIIRHMHRPGVAASITLLAVTVAGGRGCWPYGGGLNQPAVPGAGKGADGLRPPCTVIG